MVILKESMSGYDPDGNSWSAKAGDKVDHFDAETEKRLIDAGIAEPAKKDKPKK